MQQECSACGDPNVESVILTSTDLFLLLLDFAFPDSSLTIFTCIKYDRELCDEYPFKDSIMNSISLSYNHHRTTVICAVNLTSKPLYITNNKSIIVTCLLILDTNYVQIV